jgi:hypothetical protein
MLGVRRVGITNAAGLLQRQSLLHYRRGNITVLDRTGLERISCPCYRSAKDTYERILGAQSDTVIWCPEPATFRLGGATESHNGAELCVRLPRKASIEPRAPVRANLLPETNRQDDEAVLMKLQAALPHVKVHDDVTIARSAGAVVLQPPPPALDTLIGLADALMYRAKKCREESPSSGLKQYSPFT